MLWCQASKRAIREQERFRKILQWTSTVQYRLVGAICVTIICWLRYSTVRSTNYLIVSTPGITYCTVFCTHASTTVQYYLYRKGLTVLYCHAQPVLYRYYWTVEANSRKTINPFWKELVRLCLCGLDISQHCRHTVDRSTFFVLL